MSVHLIRARDLRRPSALREICLKNGAHHQYFDLDLDCRSREKRSDNPPFGQSDRLGQRGQIVVEYVLLLVVAVSLATLITRTMISQSQGQTGFVISFWQEIITQIGADKADDIESGGPAK